MSPNRKQISADQAARLVADGATLADDVRTLDPDSFDDALYGARLVP